MKPLEEAARHLKAGRLEEAERICLEATERMPENAEAHNNLGAVLQLQEQSKLAAESFRHAIALLPGYAQAHCNLGVALRKLGQLDDAIACQQRAIEIMPNYAKAHYNLGNAWPTTGPRSMPRPTKQSPRIRNRSAPNHRGQRMARRCRCLSSGCRAAAKAWSNPCWQPRQACSPPAKANIGSASGAL